MSVNYREISRRIEQEAPEHGIGAKLVSDLVTSLERQGLLPKKLPDRTLPSGEALTETKRFSPEARAILENEGYVIYTLTGQSIKSLRESGKKFWSTWHQDFPEFEAFPSRFSEVAINSNQLFLPDSNRKTLAEQEAMVTEFSRQLTQKVRGVEAIIGEAADYVELAFSHLDATSECLFGNKYNFDYARTRTPTVGSSVALVGYFRRDDGLRVHGWDRDRGDGDVWAVPLVVPKS